MVNVAKRVQALRCGFRGLGFKRFQLLKLPGHQARSLKRSGK